MIKAFSSVERQGLPPMYRLPNWHLIFVSTLNNKWDAPNADTVSANSFCITFEDINFVSPDLFIVNVASFCFIF